MNGRILRWLAAGCLVLGLAPSGLGAAREVSGQEIWFGPRADRKPGAGTRENPFPADNFVYAMSGFTFGNRDFARSTNFTVRLHPGTYLLGLGRDPLALLPDGVRMIGAGMDRTILKLKSARNANADFFVLSSPPGAGRVEVSDLTVDGSWGEPGVEAKKIGGVNITAREGFIERVRGLGFGSAGEPGKDHTQETFVLLWRAPVAGRGEIRIRECEVSGDSRGGPAGYAAALAVFGGGASADPTSPTVVISDNRVRGVGNGTGINLASVHNVLVTRNEVTASRTGFHADTGVINRVTIANNRFVDVAMGISYGEHCCTAFQDFVVVGNTVELNDRWPTGLSARWRPCAVRVAWCVTNSLIEGNTFLVAPGVSASGRARLGGIWATAPDPKHPNRGIRTGVNQFADGLRDEVGGAAR